MDIPVNLKVNFRGNAENFLVTDSERTSWESVEAMMKTSFGLGNLQVKYFDEDNEEVSINSQEEYREALKSAMKQGNQLHMNVYKVKGSVGRGPVKKEAKELRSGLRPLPLYPSMVKTVDRETQVTAPEQDVVNIKVFAKEVKGTKDQDKGPPAWFTSYMEKFKDQVVKETVDQLCREFSGQCCVHGPPRSSAEGPNRAETLVAEVSSTPSCSSCQGLASGGGYQCSVCPSCTLCELCSFSHDPSHNLVRARTPLSIPEYGVAGELSRFQKRGDRSFRKAEKQRLKAEKRQLKAEVKEIKKQLRMERRGLQQSSTSDGTPHPALLQPRGTQASSPEGPKLSSPTMMPTMTALFLDENLPDGTRLEPGTKFKKCWKMRNTGTVCWTTETKLKFMWGNLALASSDKQKEVAVPYLQPGQVGVVSVAFVAPVLEGTYTSHWRLAHRGEQFGPRVWCSIVVDSAASAGPAFPPRKPQEKGPRPSEKEGACCSSSRDCALMSAGCEREFFIPSVDLLTAQDLLSFELLDINIVQELERVPHNTPVDMTPCMSPLPHDGPLQEKPGLGLIKEESEVSGVKSLLGVTKAGQEEPSGIPAQEEGEEDISGTQFVCETVIRSLTLEEAPDHKPLRRPRPSNSKALEPSSLERTMKEPGERRLEPVVEIGTKSTEVPPLAPALTPPTAIQEQPAIPVECVESDIEHIGVDASSQSEEERDEDDGEQDEVRSQASSASSEDYIIVLPDCFDTSRPLGESMYSSALSQPGAEGGIAIDADPELPHRTAPEGEREGCRTGALATPRRSSISDMLCASQTLDTVPLTPEVVPAPAPQSPLVSAHTKRSEAPCGMELATEALSMNELAKPEGPMEGFSPAQPQGPASPSETCDTRSCTSQDLRTHGGITGGLVKGALSVAASAYKALFTGQPGPAQPPTDASSQEATMMAVLLEMGFGDRQLNQRLLRKHSYNLLDVVNELVQMSDSEWYATRY